MDKRNIDRGFTAVILCAGRGTRIAKTTKWAQSKEDADKLWDLSKELTGII